MVRVSVWSSRDQLRPCLPVVRRSRLVNFVRRRQPPTPCGRGPSRRGGRSPGTGGRCRPFDTVIHHPVPPPQSPTRRPPRQLPVSAVKARQCPRLRPLCATPLHIWSPCTAGPVIGDGHQRSRDAPANGGRAAKMAFRCDPSEPAAKGVARQEVSWDTD